MAFQRNPRGILQVDTASGSCKGRTPPQLIRSIQGGGDSGNALSTPYAPIPLYPYTLITLGKVTNTWVKRTMLHAIYNIKHYTSR
eukprot:11520727-Heterocapsa_arctica.AAC.1